MLHYIKAEYILTKGTTWGHLYIFIELLFTIPSAAVVAVATAASIPLFRRETTTTNLNPPIAPVCPAAADGICQKLELSFSTLFPCCYDQRWSRNGRRHSPSPSFSFKHIASVLLLVLWVQPIRNKLRESVESVAMLQQKTKTAFWIY